MVLSWPYAFQDMLLYNSLTKQKENFIPLKKGHASMYNCGPTVYDFAHIGNLRSFLLADILRRVLEYNGYNVKQIMNLTDVGHLTSDADEGEDKMVKALKRESKALTLENMKSIAVFYADRFKEDAAELNFKKPSALPFASEHIADQIDIIQGLEKKGFTYKTSDGIYFSTEKDPHYGKLGGVPEINEAEGRINANTEKKNPRDFALWKFGEIGWESPWGRGFPGWHIECSGMSRHYLGDSFDLHTGGIDNKPTHHNNEIAQSENYTGKIFAHYWLHGDHVNLGGEKMAKSSGGFITLRSIKEKGFRPLAYRYFLFQAHYRSKISFSWEALEAAQTALERLYENFGALRVGFFQKLFTKPDTIYTQKFLDAINDDLDMPKALAITWEVTKDTSLSNAVKRATLLDFDQVLGFKLQDQGSRIKDQNKIKISKEIEDLLADRKHARENKDWKKSDELRDKIKSLGFEVKDLPAGQEIDKI